MMDVVKIVTPAATGGDGSATATKTTTTVIRGKLVGVHLTYDGDDPATTDVTIETAGQQGPQYTLLSVSNAAADGYFAPGVAVEGGTDVLRAPAVYDRVTLSVAQANNDDVITAYLYVER